MDNNNSERTQVQIIKNGPIKVTGNYAITDANGNKLPPKNDTLYLCACGRSKGKPFCDGSHHR